MFSLSTATDFPSDTALLRVEAVARELQISRTQAYSLIRSRQIESIKIGASRRVPRQALDHYIESLRATS